MPSIATLLGRWFWWPQVVYPRGDHHLPQPPTHGTTDPDDADDTDALALPTHR
jgi:RND superfamily putative drug exporter